MSEYEVKRSIRISFLLHFCENNMDATFFHLYSKSNSTPMQSAVLYLREIVIEKYSDHLHDFKLISFSRRGFNEAGKASKGFEVMTFQSKAIAALLIFLSDTYHFCLIIRRSDSHSNARSISAKITTSFMRSSACK